MIRQLLFAALTAGTLAVPALAEEPAIAAVAAEELDPARIALAEPLALIIWPDGTYRRLIEQTMHGGMQAAMDTTLSMSGRYLPKDSKEARRVRSSNTSATQQRDSALAEAESAVARMIPIFERAEPAIRQGLARALARRFDSQQLNDLAAFFATPTGARYAGESMNLMADPDVMAATMSVMPDMFSAAIGQEQPTARADEE